TIGNEFISLLKETSIVSVIGLADLTRSFKAIADSTFEYFVPYIMLALCYLVLVIIITVLIRLLERRLRKNERR
ncbi:MAG: ABC transporter permease subunit, partial [Clostridiales bacterium]|nr:ABC transporter permease subunit [Clostridiales bacterium]